jgi:hypothetical protein
VRLTLLVVAVVGLGLVSPRASGAGPRDHLRIVVWPRGLSSPPRAVRTLNCRPAGGSFPAAASACARLAALGAPFAPVPGDVMCSQIFGGPQVALVTGSYRGRRIWARFRRTDSCQTERWNRVAFLFRA